MHFVFKMDFDVSTYLSFLEENPNPFLDIPKEFDEIMGMPGLIGTCGDPPVSVSPPFYGARNNSI